MKTRNLLIRKLGSCLLALLLPLSLACDTGRRGVRGPILFIANGSRITSYDNPAGITGNVSPQRTIEGDDTQLDGAVDIVINKGGNLLFVANFGNSTITVYAGVRANGNVKPIRKVSGASQLSNPSALAMDSRADLLYVSGIASDAKVLVFKNATQSTFNGNVEPARKFGSSAITTSGIADMFLDRNNNLYLTSGAKVLVFANASTLDGPDIMPSRTLEGPFNAVTSVFVDRNDNLFVTDSDALMRFANAATLNGVVAPDAKITGLIAPTAVVIDERGRGYVAQAFPDQYSIVSYDKVAQANGATPADRTILGANTLLQNPRGLFFLD